MSGTTPTYKRLLWAIQGEYDDPEHEPFFLGQFFKPGNDCPHVLLFATRAEAGEFSKSLDWIGLLKTCVKRVEIIVREVD